MTDPNDNPTPARLYRWRIAMAFHQHAAADPVVETRRAGVLAAAGYRVWPLEAVMLAELDGGAR